MNGFSTDKDRKVIPRWRTFDQTLRLGELNSIAPPRKHHQVTSDFLVSKIRDWLEHHTVGHATDLVGSALTLKKEKEEREVAEAARFLLRENLSVSPWARELAKQALKSSEDTEIVLAPEALEKPILYKEIRTLKHLLRTEPKDPITWVELSRLYAILGHGDQAEKSMTVALQLAMNNRFVLRSASRLWIYRDDPEKAHDIIGRADRTRYDPWLLAAEIAIGSINRRRPKFVKSARRMLSDGKISPVHISELASAVATLELASGSIKNSKKLFRLSLKHPTENSIAQVAWVSRYNSTILLDDEYLNRPNTFEARSWYFYSQSIWEKAIQACRQWEYDQPFSSRPSIRSSYVSATALEDYARSEQFAKQGLRANPENSTLLNNLAFARINLGDINGAKEVLSKVKRLSLSDQEWVSLQATRGLLAFRTGNVGAGRKLYSEARSKAQKMKDSRLFALASVFYAIEEISHKTPDANAVRSETLYVLQKERDPIFRILEHRLTNIAPHNKGRNTRD